MTCGRRILSLLVNSKSSSPSPGSLSVATGFSRNLARSRTCPLLSVSSDECLTCSSLGRYTNSLVAGLPPFEAWGFLSRLASGASCL